MPRHMKLNMLFLANVSMFHKLLSPEPHVGGVKATCVLCCAVCSSFLFTPSNADLAMHLHPNAPHHWLYNLENRGVDYCSNNVYDSYFLKHLLFVFLPPIDLVFGAPVEVYSTFSVEVLPCSQNGKVQGWCKRRI